MQFGRCAHRFVRRHVGLAICPRVAVGSVRRVPGGLCWRTDTAEQRMPLEGWRHADFDDGSQHGLTLLVLWGVTADLFKGGKPMHGYVLVTRAPVPQLDKIGLTSRHRLSPPCHLLRGQPSRGVLFGLGASSCAANTRSAPRLVCDAH